MASSVPGLTVCMIVRDEARTLGRCLASIAGLYDELCVVDTGSSDDSVAVLLSHGARVITDTSCNGEDGRIVDFARARNAVLAIATGDWILQIDADEVLAEGHEHVLESLVGGHACVAVTIESDGARWTSGRLFERRRISRYCSPVHEYVEYEGRTRKVAGIVVRNLPDKSGKEPSDRRNSRILEQALQEVPEDGRLWHFLGNEHYRAQRFQEAGRCYDRAALLGNFRAGRYHTLYYLGCSLLMAGEREQAEEAAHRAVRLDDRFAEAHCLLGDIHFLRHQFAQSRVHYQRALACVSPPEDAVMAPQSWAYDAHPRAQIKRIDALGERALADEIEPRR